MARHESQDQWVLDHKAEAVLKDLNIKPKRGIVKTKEINFELSSANIGREDGEHDEDKVVEMAIALDAGDKFPMPIIMKLGDQWIVCAGYHRVLAADTAGLLAISAYIIGKQTSGTLRLIGMMTNAREGDRIDRKVKVRFAANECIMHDVSPVVMARKLHINPSLIQSKIKALRLRDEAVKHAKTNIDKLHESTLTKLFALAGNEKVLAAAADLCFKAKLTGIEAGDLARDTKKRKTEAKQLAYIEDRTQLHKSRDTDRSPVGQKIRTSFLRGFGSLYRACQGKSALSELELFKDSEDVKRLKAQWLELRKTLNTIFH